MDNGINSEEENWRAEFAAPMDVAFNSVSLVLSLLYKHFINPKREQGQVLDPNYDPKNLQSNFLIADFGERLGVINSCDTSFTISDDRVPVYGCYCYWKLVPGPCTEGELLAFLGLEEDE